VSQRNMNKVGVGIAVVLGAIGLVAVGFMVFMAIALQSFGSNK
jgi:hypothetical protein